MEKIMDPADVVGLFVSFQRRLEQIVRGSVRAPGPLIEDACQTAWLELISHRERIDVSGAPAWLVTTATHAAMRLAREEHQEDSLELTLESSPQPTSVDLDADPQEVVWCRQRVDLVTSLPVRQQRLLWLWAFGLTLDELALHEHCTRRTVRRQLERARRTLRAA
jgi:RNA polymerase sigma factor (sigma-70 family)